NHVKSAARTQDALAVLDELRREQPSLQVSFLPPRIREIDMDALHRLGRHAIPEEEPGVRTGDTNVSQSPFRQPGCRVEFVFPDDFDPKKIGVRAGLCRGEKE